MPDTDFLLNLDDQVLKNTEENYPYNPTCLPNSPASSSSCDDGYGSDGKSACALLNVVHGVGIFK